MQLAQHLRQMLALLESERQALAGLDLDRILVCAEGKEKLCGDFSISDTQRLDEECHGLLEAVIRLNIVNRKLRNVIADNVQSRLEALTGMSQSYGARKAALETHQA